MKNAPVRVLIADGDPLVCRALARLLGNNADVEVVATAVDRNEVLELAGQFRPAVALVDAHTPRMDGMDVTRRLYERFPETRVIILGVYEALRDEALRAGACHFLLKDGGRAALVAAIQLAASGQCEGDLHDMGENDSPRGQRPERLSTEAANTKETNLLPGLNTNDPNDIRVATGKLKDGWTYDIRSIPKTDRFCATVLHPYGDASSGGVPWPIEDPTFAEDPAHPTYPTIDAAVSAARAYIEILGELHGYPDPDKMSARGLRPALW